MKKKILLLVGTALLFFAVTSMAQVPSYVPSNGLIGYFGFTNSANDAISLSIPTSNSAIPCTDRFGIANSAYQFNGSNIIKYNGSNPLGTIGNSNQTFAINFWINATNTSVGTILGAFGWGYSVNFTSTNKISFTYINTSLTWSTYNSLSSISANSWHMITIIKSGTTVTIYIDNVVDNTIATVPNINTYSSSNCWFGGEGQDNNGYINGKLDEIGMWNRALTQIEITALYQGVNNYTVPNYVSTNGLVGWWPFNGNANDESGNGNNGTVSGSILTTDRLGNTNSAYSFNGTNNKITVADAISLEVTSTATFSLWTQINQINFDNGNSNDYDARLIDKSTPGLNNGYLIDYNHRITSSNPSYSNQCTTGSTRIRAVMGNSINLTSCYSGYLNWTHIVITFNNGNINVFNNGMLSGTFTSSNNSIPTNNIPLIFGYQTSGTGITWLNGKLDDIGIWNRVLTQAEIIALYTGCNLTITTNPANQSINVNNIAQFVVAASDTSATYLWQTDLGLGFQNISNAGQYSGATNDTLIVSNATLTNNNQQFRCIVTSGTCIDTSSVAVLSVINNVGINEAAANNLFKVYPNPANSQINVEINTNLIGSIYTITDQIGKTVLSGKLTKENSTIELGDLSGGIYLLSIGNNAKQTFKVIKK